MTSQLGWIRIGIPHTLKRSRVVSIWAHHGARPLPRVSPMFPIGSGDATARAGDPSASQWGTAAARQWPGARPSARIYVTPAWHPTCPMLPAMHTLDDARGAVAAGDGVRAWHALDVCRTAALLGSDLERGLGHAEARRRLARVGANRVAEGRDAPLWRLALSQFASLVVLLLLL